MENYFNIDLSQLVFRVLISIRGVLQKKIDFDKWIRSENNGTIFTIKLINNDF